MVRATGPQDLPDFEDRILFHLVDITGNDPVVSQQGISEDDIAERLGEEPGFQANQHHTPGFYGSSERLAILEAVQSLKVRGYVEYRAVSGPWSIKPTYGGRQQVANWRQEWTKTQQAQERELTRAILLDLDTCRQTDPAGYNASSRLNVEKLCADLEIGLPTFLRVAQRLIDEGKIASIGGESLAEGYFYITDRGIQTLQTIQGGQHWQQEAARAWNEVAILRRRLEVAERSLPTLIADPELRRRCEDLLIAGEHYDRVVREACVILENRVRSAIGADATVVGVSLMERAFSPRVGPLQLSAIEQEQVGLMQMFRGVMAFFRNSAGHRIIADYTQEQALRFVISVDMLLDLVAQALARHP